MSANELQDHARALGGVVVHPDRAVWREGYAAALRMAIAELDRVIRGDGGSLDDVIALLHGTLANMREEPSAITLVRLPGGTRARYDRGKRVLIDPPFGALPAGAVPVRGDEP